MERRTRLWIGLGAAMLGGATAAAPAPATLKVGLASGGDVSQTLSPGIQLAQADAEEGGEGGEGEGGEGGVVTIKDYRLRSTDPTAFQYDAKPQVAANAALAHESYASALNEAEKLVAAVAALLKDPNPQTLAGARFAWLNARPAYLQTEAFRFYGGPIDGPLERRLNAWPINEGFLDYVEGKPNGGLVNDPSLEMTLDTIVGRHQAADPGDVTTGWHAIEFLLWGEDRSATGAGARPHTDFVAGSLSNDRRREYLRLASALLVNDLGNLVAAWAPERDNFRSSLMSLDHANVIGRAFHGMAVLASFELASKRIAADLESGDDRDEHSRFSDNTGQDHASALRGIRNVYFGSAKGAEGAGFDALLARVDPAFNQRVIASLDRAEHAVAALDLPYDRILLSPPGSPARAEAAAAVTALQDLAEALRAAGNRLGVLVLMIPGE